MRELELTLTLRNNRLKQRRLDLGWTQAQLARAASISLARYGALEGLRRAAWTRVHTCWSRRRCDAADPCVPEGWTDDALALARFFCVEPEELFPDVVLAVVAPVQTRRIDAHDADRLLSSHHERLLLVDPCGEAEHKQLCARLSAAVERLPKRHADVIRRRFGLAADEEETLEEIGDSLGVSRERVRGIEAQSLRMLRHPDAGLRERQAPRERPTRANRVRGAPTLAGASGPPYAGDVIAGDAIEETRP